MVALETPLIIAATLLIGSVLASKLAARFGVPALLLFILIGMLLGSEGPGGIAFDDPALTQTVGVVALVFILFSGGMDTNWQAIRPVLKEGILLSTLGVALTALIVGWLAVTFLGFTWPTGILLGATMASTDAAAVFAILRSKNVGLRGHLKPLLELESGSNDPMAVFLTLGMIQVITVPGMQVIDLAGMFFVQMGLGVALGFLLGELIVRVLNIMRLEYDGLYSVVTIGFVLLCYGLTSVIGGNGFMAIYVAGIVLGNRNFIHKNSLAQFHDGLAWLMQIVMFIVLGLQVFPSRLVTVAGAGLLVACFLIFVARPLSVFALLTPLRVPLRERTLIAWVGLRGAAPIILGTFSLIAGVTVPTPIFDLVFFVVLVSVLLQGMTLIPVARTLGLQETAEPSASLLDRILQEGHFLDFMLEVQLPKVSGAIGMRLVDLPLPEGALVVLIKRDSRILIPQGGTSLQPDDQLLVMAPRATHSAVTALLTAPPAEKQNPA